MDKSDECILDKVIPNFKDQSTNTENDILPDKIKCLVFSGGGVKGFCHIGCLKALEEVNLYPQIECIIGSSCGSIIALLFNLNYNYETLKEILLGIDLTNIQDITSESILNYFNHFGFDKGTKMEKIVRIFIKKKVGNENISFKQLFIKTGKKLVITGSCLNNGQCKEFSYDTTPDLPIITAIKVSISIPFVFTAQQLEGETFVDGALTQNLPLELVPNKYEVLAFYIKNEKYFETIDNLETYAAAVLNCIDSKYIYIYQTLYPDLIIYLEVSLDSLNFDIDRKSREKLFLEGYQKTSAYLEKHKNRV